MTTFSIRVRTLSNAIGQDAALAAARCSSSTEYVAITTGGSYFFILGSFRCVPGLHRF
jgi:hypothetical protein